MWATPGPYLRRTMLESLARKASNIMLPEVFWKMVSETTFEQFDPSPAMSPEQEELNGTFLALRCKEYMDSRGEFYYEDEDVEDYDSDNSKYSW